MRVLKEKVLAVRGDFVVKGRVVVFNTKETGEVRRGELFLEKVTVPGQPENPLGWSLNELAHLHNMLVGWLRETNEEP